MCCSPCSLPSCLSHVERAPPLLLLKLELALTQLSQWALAMLQRSTSDIHQAMTDTGGSTLACSGSSRFLVCGVTLLLNSIHHPVSLATLLNDGVLPLSQAVLSICGPLKSLSIGAGDEAINEDSREGLHAPPTPTEDEVTGLPALQRIVPMARVIRGPDWKWGDQVREEGGGSGRRGRRE